MEEALCAIIFLSLCLITVMHGSQFSGLGLAVQISVSREVCNFSGMALVTPMNAL